MAVVVVAGQARKVGKTSVMAGLIAATAEMQWTAMKITQHEHGESGEAVVIFEERDAGSGTDSGRYLAAGAARSLWVRAADLDAAIPRIQAEMAEAENLIVESNSVLEFLRPDVCVMVLDGRVRDFKMSAKRHLDKADVLLVMGDDLPCEADSLKARIFPGSAEAYCSAELVEFVKARLRADD